MKVEVEGMLVWKALNKDEVEMEGEVGVGREEPSKLRMREKP